jgi:hypothetical protein
VPIRGFIEGTDKFPIQKCAIFRKFKEIGGIARRHSSVCRTRRFQTCHARGVIDAEIAEKGHLWMDTSQDSDIIDGSYLNAVEISNLMWFHREFRMDEWLLYVMTNPNACKARGLSNGRVYTREGKLVASVTQEGLIRCQSLKK